VAYSIEDIGESADLPVIIGEKSKQAKKGKIQ